MAICPNKRRKRALMSGNPGCNGSLEVTVMVPVTLKVKRVPKGGETILDVINKGSQKSHRVGWRMILENLLKGSWDLKCDTCGWSLSHMRKGLQRKVRGRIGKTTKKK